MGPVGARLSVRGAMDCSSFCVLVVGFGQFHAQRVVSFLGCAVPVHSSAPHNILELHNALVSSAAGQSLVAGVGTPPEPDVEGLVSRLGTALRPFQERYLLSRRGQKNSCSDEYEMVKPDSFLAGMSPQWLFELRVTERSKRSL